MKRFAASVALLLVFAFLLGACDDSPAPNTSRQVQVTLGEFFVHSNRTTFLARTPYHLTIHNTGAQNHDFVIMAPGSTHLQSMDTVYQQAVAYVYNIAPGATKTLDVTFQHTAPQGVLDMGSHYSGQYEAGMRLPIIVSAPAGQSLSPYPKPSSSTTVKPGQGTDQDACDGAITVTLADKVFSPDTVALNRGDTLTIHNTVNKEYTLMSKPDSGMRYTVISANETEFIPFLKAGTFTISSREVPAAKLKVAVGSKQGTTCGFVPGPTVSFEANYHSGKVGHYFWSNQTVTIKEGQNITLSNLTDKDLTFKSAPDANVTQGVELDPNEQQFVMFPAHGVYTITCLQFPKTPIKVIVGENH